MTSVDSLTASFFDNPQYSDIIVKFGGRQIRAHKVILAQQSGYFAAAFFSRFQVASNPVIDLGDEDDPELLADTIKYLYRHGRVQDQLRGLDPLLSMNGLVDIYQLADKYDIRSLRHDTISRLYTLASSVFRGPVANATSTAFFLDCVTRVCGPESLQLADSRLKAKVMKVCQENCISLFQDKTFLQRYKRGGLFDVESAAAFGMELGGRLLINSGMPAGEADGLLDLGHERNTISYYESPYMIDFFNDGRFSDVTVTCSGHKIFAHKIFLTTHSLYFQKVLEGSPTISEIELSNEDDFTATAAFLQHMYSADRIPARHETPWFLARMYLVALKHGRRDVADTFKENCEDELNLEEFSDQYFADVAVLCGPNASSFADTSLPDMVFDAFLRDMKYMNDDEAEWFKQKYSEGVLFNAEFTRRFGTWMLDHYREHRSMDDEP